MKTVRQSYRAFTVIEMLVTIAILAVLSTLLLVSYRTTYTKVMETKASGQLRQIGMAFMEYANDNSGNLATVQTTTGNASEYMLLIGPYMGYAKFYSLPNIAQAPLFFSPLYHGRAGNPWPWNFTFNERFTPKNNSASPVKLAFPRIQNDFSWAVIPSTAFDPATENSIVYLLRDCVHEYNAAYPKNKVAEWPNHLNVYLFLDGHVAFHDMTDTSPGWTRFP